MARLRFQSARIVLAKNPEFFGQVVEVIDRRLEGFIVQDQAAIRKDVKVQTHVVDFSFYRFQDGFKKSFFNFQSRELADFPQLHGKKSPVVQSMDIADDSNEAGSA